MDSTQVPEDCRKGYAEMVAVLVRAFSMDRQSGEAVLRFKSGVPIEVEPHTKIRLDAKNSA